MIIDSHVHLKHGDSARTEYTGEQIVRTMDDVGIDVSVVFAMSTTTVRSIAMAQEAVDAFPDRLIPYVYALPRADSSIMMDLRRAISDLGFKGIKIHRGECSMAEYVIDPVLELAGELGVPVLIDFLGRVPDCERLAATFPKTTILAAHIGQYLATNTEVLDRFISIAEAYPNVYLDASGVVTLWKIKDAVGRVGAERVMWGTDGPHLAPDTAEFARTELNKVYAVGLREEEEGMVLGGSIAKLLRL